jgi:hypothetical protein
MLQEIVENSCTDFDILLGVSFDLLTPLKLRVHLSSYLIEKRSLCVANSRLSHPTRHVCYGQNVYRVFRRFFEHTRS